MTESSVLYFIGHRHCMTKAVADSSSSLIQYFHNFSSVSIPVLHLISLNENMASSMDNAKEIIMNHSFTDCYFHSHA